MSHGWGCEIVPHAILIMYKKQMQNNTCTLLESFDHYRVGYIDIHADIVIKSMLESYFKQCHLYGCAGHAGHV